MFFHLTGPQLFACLRPPGMLIHVLHRHTTLIPNSCMADILLSIYRLHTFGTYTVRYEPCFTDFCHKSLRYPIFHFRFSGQFWGSGRWGWWSWWRILFWGFQFQVQTQLHLYKCRFFTELPQSLTCTSLTSDIPKNRGWVIEKKLLLLLDWWKKQGNSLSSNIR